MNSEAALPVSITLKNIPEPLYDRIKASAEEHRRSFNMEAITLLENALAPKRIISVEERIERAKSIRKSLGPITITDEDINAFKNEGRK